MTTATMTISRVVQVPKFYDAAGVPETEAEDINIEVTVSGQWCAAEPDVGIFSPWFEVDGATDENGNDVELTSTEKERAQQALMGAHRDDRAEALEYRAEARRERME